MTHARIEIVRVVDAEEARRTLLRVEEEVRRLGVTDRARDGLLSALGRLFHEVLNSRTCEAARMDFDAWVETMTDGYGRPRKPAWARGLAFEYNVIAQQPALERAAQAPPPGSNITHNSAYYSAKLCELDDWEGEERKRWRAKHGAPDSPEAYLAEGAHVRETVDRRLLQTAEEKASRLKKKYLERKENKGLAGAPQGDQWIWFGGALNPESTERWRRVVAAAYQLQGDKQTGKESFAADFDRVLVTIEDLLNAIAAAGKGDSGPMGAVLEGPKS